MILKSKRKLELSIRSTYLRFACVLPASRIFGLRTTSESLLGFRKSIIFHGKSYSIHVSLPFFGMMSK